MPDIVVTWAGEPVGRLSCTQEFADAVASALLDGRRLELSGGFLKPQSPAKPTLVEFVVSPLFAPPTDAK